MVYIMSHTKYISVSVSKIPIQFQNSTINFARFSHPTSRGKLVGPVVRERELEIPKAEVPENVLMPMEP